MRFKTATLVLLFGLVACSSDDEPPQSRPDAGGHGEGDAELPPFAAAVPSADLATIDFPEATGKLPATSEAVGAVAEYVGAVNGDIRFAFDLVGVGAGGVIEARGLFHQRWRGVYDATRDVVLDLWTTTDPGAFELEARVGAADFDPDLVDPAVHGVVIVSLGAVWEFDLQVELAALTAAFPLLDAAGALRLSLRRPAGLIREVWYDFAGVSLGSVPIPDQLSTYWTFTNGSHALEFEELTTSSAIAYARWGAAGGRLDHYVHLTHETLGPVHELETGCWGLGGVETFFGYALQDLNGAYWGVKEGSENACLYGPLADYPATLPDYAVLLPRAGEWEWMDLAPLP